MLPYCSIIHYETQEIPSGPYTLLKFSGTSYDPHGMVSENRQLIIPSCAGIGILELNIHWEAGDYRKLRDVFTRDPYGIGPDPAEHDNRTGYDHRPPNRGMSCFTKQHQLLVDPGTPLGVYVAHDASDSVKVTHAQLKLTILT